MPVLDFNANTKKVSFEEDSLTGLSNDELTSASQTTDLINTIMDNLVHYNGENPPVNTFNDTVSQSASKLARSGSELLKSQKPAEAVKLFDTAIEMILRRPIWESTVKFIAELSICLGARCDAYIQLQQFDDAYADASLLTLMNSTDSMNYFRKAITLLAAAQYDEGENLLRTALSLSPNNPLYLQTLKNARTIKA